MLGLLDDAGPARGVGGGAVHEDELGLMVLMSVAPGVGRVGARPSIAFVAKSAVADRDQPQ